MADELFSVEGKRCFVTGGTSGIGRMIVDGLAERGARVFTCSRKQASVDAVVQELTERGFDVAGCAADLSKMDDIVKAAEAVSAHFGGALDVLVNNAGATWGATIDAYPESGWDKVFDLNVKAMFFTSQKCLPMLRKTGKRPDALSRIIHIGSISGIQYPSGDGAWAYHPAKAAVHHLTCTMAKELVKEGISVNAIAPGLFPSKMTAFMMPDGNTEAVGGFIPMGRPGMASDMVGTVVYLASKAGAFANGALIKIDGGSALG